MNNIATLTWDSNFFNRTIGQIHLSSIDAVNLFQEEFRMGSFELVYVTAESEKISNKIAELFGLNPIEYKRTYSLSDVSSLSPISQYDILEIKELSPRLKELAFQSGTESRFFKDSNIPIVDFEKLYSTWIEKSVHGELANHVFGVMMLHELVGFATLAFKTDFAQVGLIAVHPDFRGKGIAKTLMNVCIAQSQKVGKMPLKVVTQAHNISACSLYESMGFKELSSVPLFHIWKTN